MRPVDAGEAVVSAGIVGVLWRSGGGVERTRPSVVSGQRQAALHTATGSNLQAVVIGAVAMIRHINAAVPWIRSQCIDVDAAIGSVETRAYRQLVDVDGPQEMLAQVADVADVEDYVARNFLLHAEVVRDDAGVLECLRQHTEVGGERARRTA